MRRTDSEAVTSPPHRRCSNPTYLISIEEEYCDPHFTDTNISSKEGSNK
jgi:hypothetical protein